MTSAVKVRNVTIGGGASISIQSMTNTKTHDVQATLNQINDLASAGCDIVRVAVLDQEDAQALQKIVPKSPLPVVADIHFDYRLALVALEAGVDKLRINPGNIKNVKHLQAIVLQAKARHVPIRIGVNLGSLASEIEAQYGRTAKALVMSAQQQISLLESLDFHDIVISLKASDVQTTVEAYRLAHQTFNYPLHLGVTEAGTLEAGTIKSAAALGSLLLDGIGDTIRISLAADPVQEVAVALELLKALGLRKGPQLIACPSCGRCQYDYLQLANRIDAYLKTIPHVSIKVAVMGCIVNGIGEAGDSDLGFAGINQTEGALFVNHEIKKRIPYRYAYQALVDEINNFIKSDD